MTDFKSVKKKEMPAARPLKWLPQVKKDYVPKPNYQFLSRQEKEVIDSFTVDDLNYNLQHDNVLNVLWVCGIITDRIKKFPTAPINSDHKAVLERIGQIFEEWGIINEKLNKQL